MSTGIASQEQVNVAIYPNPTQGNLYVVNKENAPITVSISDILGKNVYQNVIRNTETIDFNVFGKGFYFVTIQQNNKSQTFKIMNGK